MKAFLVDQIGDAYLDAEKSDKWVDYQAQRRLSSRIDGVLDAANKSVRNGDFEPVIVAGFEILRCNIKLRILRQSTSPQMLSTGISFTKLAIISSASQVSWLFVSIVSNVFSSDE